MAPPGEIPAAADTTLPVTSGRYRAAAWGPVLGAVVLTIGWLQLLPPRASIDPAGVAQEGLLVVAALLGYVFVVRIRLAILQLGWALVTFGLYIDVLDELREAGLLGPIVEMTSLAVGYPLVAAGFFLSQRRLRDEFERRLEAQSALRSATLERERAEAASQAKSSFLAHMSHEIRNPLNAVLGLVDLLMRTDLDVRQRGYVERARRSAESLLGLLNDVLDHSRIAAGKLTIESTEFDLRAVVREVAELHAPWADEQGIEVAVRYPIDAPRRVVSDSGRVRQVLMNLVGNAVKFTEAGHVLVDVVGFRDGDAARLRIEVRDTGVGIAPDRLEGIFGDFVQVDASTTRRHSGAGLGLAISRSIAELLGGTLDALSTPGGGSTFRLTLDLPIGMDEPAGLPSTDRLAGLRVLVVDDASVTRELLSERLSAWGLRPTAARDEVSARAALADARDQGDPFVAAIIDQHLSPSSSQLGGESFARTLARDAEADALAILLMSSFGLRGDARRAAEIGVAGYLTKPVLEEDLAEMLLAAVPGPSRGDRRSRTTGAPSIERRARRRSLSTAPSAWVLFVDDSEVNREVATDMLALLGYGVDIAADGVEAVELFDPGRHTLVFMDCQMPRMDGYEATAALRDRHPTEPKVPIIAVTAHALPADRERCLAAGMDDYIAKPISFATLEAALARWGASTAATGGGAP